MRTISCNFLSYQQKKEVLKNVKELKVSNIFINVDFCFEKCNAGMSSGKKCNVLEVRVR